MMVCGLMRMAPGTCSNPTNTPKRADLMTKSSGRDRIDSSSLNQRAVARFLAGVIVGFGLVGYWVFLVVFRLLSWIARR